MKKLYCRIQYDKQHHTIIRVDDLKEFQIFFKDEQMHLHFKLILSELKLGNKPEIKPYQFEINQEDFDQLVRVIKKKIASVHSKGIHFNSISLVEDSVHYPVIKIVIKEPENTIID